MPWIVNGKQNKSCVTTEWAVYKRYLHCILLGIVICDKLNYVPTSFERSALSGGISHFKCFFNHFRGGGGGVTALQSLVFRKLRAVKLSRRFARLCSIFWFVILKVFKKPQTEPRRLQISRSLQTDSTNRVKAGAVSSRCPGCPTFSTHLTCFRLFGVCFELVVAAEVHPEQIQPILVQPSLRTNTFWNYYLRAVMHTQKPPESPHCLPVPPLPCVFSGSVTLASHGVISVLYIQTHTSCILCRIMWFAKCLVRHVWDRIF